MNALENCLLIVAIPAVLMLAGYALALAADASERATETAANLAAPRLALASLAGLAVLTWTVSLVNLLCPLDRFFGLVCLLPALPTVALRGIRQALGRDLGALFSTRQAWLLTAAAVVALGFLLWPLLSRPDVVFYDGTGNHDAFFWITGAEYLKRFTYLEPPIADPTHPLFAPVAAFTGWAPVWGRMGGEGLLALVSAVAGASPLKLYLASTAALYIPWLAAVFLIVRTFFARRIPAVAAFALVAAQPMFVFFHTNANLPNLLGALHGTLAIIATAGLLAGSRGSLALGALLALSVHGLICSYPEMAPVVALPCLCLCARAAWRADWPRIPRPLLLAIGAACAGLLLNPVSTIRAWSGLRCSLAAADFADRWPNIFATAEVTTWPAAMLTLSPQLGRNLGLALGGGASVLLLVAGFGAIRAARDQFGALALLTGSAALLAYTVRHDFGYGWQKLIQFNAPVLAAFLPVGALAAIDTIGAGGRRWLSRLGAVSILAIFGGALVLNTLHAHTYSERKFLTRDWFAARDYARAHLHNEPLLIDGRNFTLPFFYTMWATYFFPDNRIYFAGEDVANGGYLRPLLTSPSRSGVVPRPTAIVIATSAAERDFPTHERLFAGPVVTLLGGADLPTTPSR